MNFLKLIFFTTVFSASLGANALLISDVYEVNGPLVSGKYENVLFNLTDHGYNHLTDNITSLKLSFDLTEIIDTEEDLDDWPQDGSDFEFMIFYSWIFDHRSIWVDVDTGVLTFESSWNKNYECQVINSVDGDETCVENLDLNGELSTSFIAYTDNLWLGEIRLDAEVTRVAIPEPSSIFLLCLGLIGLGIGRYRLKNC